MKKLFVIALSLLISANALGAEWQVTTRIDNIRIDQVGNIYGNTIETIPMSGCNTTSFMLPKSQDGFEIMVSFLLAATAANREIKLKVGECFSASAVLVEGVRFNGN